jgi:hypothetical protein
LAFDAEKPIKAKLALMPINMHGINSLAAGNGEISVAFSPKNSAKAKLDWALASKTGSRPLRGDAGLKSVAPQRPNDLI